MRHGCNYRKLSRKPHKRMALLRNLATNLFEHERIKTTVARGKELKRFADRLITCAIKGNEESWKRLTKEITKPVIVHKAMTTLAQRYMSRPGGYTRFLHAGNRPSDNAPVAFVELVGNPGDLKQTFQKMRDETKLAGGIIKFLKPTPPPTPLVTKPALK